MEALLDTVDGRRKLIRLAIVAAIGLQLVVELKPKLYNFAYPMSPETIQAVHVWETNRTAEAEAAMWKQWHQSSRDNQRRVHREGLIWLGSFVLLDFLAVYYFWNYGVTQKAA